MKIENIGCIAYLVVNGKTFSKCFLSHADADREIEALRAKFTVDEEMVVDVEVATLEAEKPEGRMLSKAEMN